LYRIE